MISKLGKRSLSGASTLVYSAHMQPKLIAVTVLFFVILAAGVALIVIPAPEAAAPVTQNPDNTQTPATSTNPHADLIQPDLVAGSSASSPLVLTGKARGNWYFEASFPVEIRDASGKVIAQHYAEAQSDWMTTEFVAFKSTVTFPAQPAGSKGTVVFHKDNPSGLPENDKSVHIPIVFQ